MLHSYDIFVALRFCLFVNAGNIVAALQGLGEAEYLNFDISWATVLHDDAVHQSFVSFGTFAVS